jgi:hypothetical protein
MNTKISIKIIARNIRDIVNNAGDIPRNSKAILVFFC